MAGNCRVSLVEILGTEKWLSSISTYELDSMAVFVFLAQLSCVGIGVELGKLVEDKLALLLEISNR